MSFRSNDSDCEVARPAVGAESDLVAFGARAQRSMHRWQMSGFGGRESAAKVNRMNLKCGSTGRWVRRSRRGEGLDRRNGKCGVAGSHAVYKISMGTLGTLWIRKPAMYNVLCAIKP